MHQSFCFRRITTVLLITAAVTAGRSADAGPYRDAVLADDPVAYWGLGETDPTQMATNLGLLGQLDEGHGTYSETALVGQPSLVLGEADGSFKAAAGSRMVTEEFDKFSDVAGFGGSGFSVEFWTAIERTSPGFTNLVGDGVSGGDFNLMVYLGSSGFIRPHVRTEDLGLGALDSTRVLNPGDIVHVVSTWDAFSGDLTLYLDGEEAETTVPFGTIPNDGLPESVFNPIFIGQDGREPSPNAWIDEVAIYNYPLAPARVQQHFDLGKGAMTPLPEPPQPFPDPGNLPGLPSGLVTYIDFDEAGGPGDGGVLDFAYDRQDENDGSFQGNATRVPGLIGRGAAAFDNTGGTQVALGPGTDDNFSTFTGITVEALIQTEWTGDSFDYDEIFRKEDGGNRILFSFQNDTFGGGANPPVDEGPVLSFGLNTEGYQELDMPLNVPLDELDGGNPNSGTVWLRLPADEQLGPNDVVLADGQTHHTVATYDQATGEKAIWIDGVKRWSVNIDGEPEIVSGGGAIAYIGSTNGGENFNGIIDEFAFWERALSEAEVAAHFANIQAGLNYFGVGGNPFDFDGDGTITLADLDLLQAEIRAGTNEARFDVNGDGTLSTADISEFVTSPDTLNTYIGDANGDGEFSSGDLVAVFQAGKFETGQAANWAQGDWNGDGQFGSGDLVFAFQDGGFEQGPRQAVMAHAVPEPAGITLLLLGLTTSLLGRRRR